MNFGIAMCEILAGSKLRRQEWSKVDHVRLDMVSFGLTARRTLIIVMKDGNVNAYAPSQCDMTADDWEIVP